MKVGDKVVCKKYYFTMTHKGVAYIYIDKCYEIIYHNQIGINIKDDNGISMWFSFTGSNNFYDYFLTLAEYRDKRINDILDESR